MEENNVVFQLRLQTILKKYHIIDMSRSKARNDLRDELFELLRLNISLPPAETLNLDDVTHKKLQWLRTNNQPPELNHRLSMLLVAYTYRRLNRESLAVQLRHLAREIGRA